MFSIKKYNPLFPTIPIVWAVLLYFNWVGLTLAKFSGHPILGAFVLAGHVLLLFLMNYYPIFAIKHRSHVQTQEFFFTGQGYFEAAAIAILGWMLNWIPCPPVIKYSVFLSALPLIHFSLTKHFNVETPQPLHYPDVGRPPFNP